MRASSFLAPLFLAATVVAQAVEEGIAPDSPPPKGCETTVDGNFTIGTLKIDSPKSRRETAQEAADGALFCTLEDGVLRDQYGRTGSVVANRQFQFDGPPQAGAIYTGGFSVCKNNSLAIGGTTRWWQCSSGPFYNLYDEWIGGQCEEIRIQVGLLDNPSASTSSPPPSSATSSDISGVVSTLSATVSGLTTSFRGSASPTSVASTDSLSATGSITSDSTPTDASSSSSPTVAAAPPAQNGTASAGHVARGVLLAAVMAIFGTILIH